MKLCRHNHDPRRPETCSSCRGLTPKSQWGFSTAPAGRRSSLPARRFDRCPHLGGPTGEQQECPTCSGSVRIPLLACSIHGTCTVGKPLAGIACCESCPDHPAAAPPLVPVSDVILDGSQLVADQNQMNCSILPYKGRLLLAYRTGWAGSRVHVCELDSDYRPRPSTTLSLDHPLCVGGREDPRLFVHADRLHLAFCGVRVVRENPREVVARQLFAVLTDDLRAERIWEPQYPAAEPWEKNWMPFSHDGRLYVVYSLRPWVVLELLPDGNTVPVGEPHTGLPWSHGSPRGGAPPVRHGNEYYCFFHGTDGQYDPKRYTMGVCTFAAAPPFHPLRCTRAPILRPDMERYHTIHRPGVRFAATVFPCGAFRDGERWIASLGDCDHFCRIVEFDAAEIEGVLGKLASSD